MLEKYIHIHIPEDESALRRYESYTFKLDYT